MVTRSEQGAEKQGQPKKIGIFGGSFDPVHLGHITLAEDAMHQMGLEQVVFIPARLQPFKLDKKLTSGEDRVSMLHLALHGIDGMSISRYELDHDGVSYTYLTMRAMQERLGEGAKLYFITGADSFLKIETWRNAQELLQNYAYIIGSRPGYREAELAACIDRVRVIHNTEIHPIHNVQIDVSSTEIRKALQSGASAKKLIPAEVERYIKKNGLYR